MLELLRYRDVTRVAYFRGLLEQAGIATFIRNDHVSTTEVSIPEFFPALCIVNDSDKQRAIDLIREDLVSNADPDDLPERICGDCREASPANFDTCWSCGTSFAAQ